MKRERMLNLIIKMLRANRQIVLQYQSPDSVCGYVRNIGRDGEEKRILSLKQLQEAHLDMFTTVYIGNSQTTVMDGRMVTPRGYLL